MWPWVMGAPKNLGSPYNISATAEPNLTTLSLTSSCGLHSTIIKSHAEEKEWPWTRGAPQNLEVSLKYLHNG